MAPGTQLTQRLRTGQASAFERLVDPPPGTPVPDVFSQATTALDLFMSPAEATRRLLALGPFLLESRTQHPGARWSYVALFPILTVTARNGYLEEAGPDDVAQLVSDAPWPRLMDWLEAYRGPDRAGPPFQGGWVGWLAHEAASWVLQEPVADLAPPARPDLPWAHFRFFPDVLVFDHQRGTTALIQNDVPCPLGPMEQRRRQVLAALQTPSATADLPATTGPATMSLDPTGFVEQVARLQELVRQGDCFQANLTASFAYAWQRTPSVDALLSLYEAYAGANPGPWCAFVPHPEATLLCASPELLVDLDGPRLRLRPIAGTRPRGSTAAQDQEQARQLQADAKERAEHAMLVDLARNDAAAVCVPGSVSVPNLAGVERYRHVMHLVSQVEGQAMPDLSLAQLLTAVFPGGTVTGAPKRRAFKRIGQCEGGPRGPYTGALAYVSVAGSTQWNLLIRTLVATPTHLTAHAGCGIVEGSRPQMELAELEAKARAQVEAATGQTSPALPQHRCGAVEPGPAWAVDAPSSPLGRARVLLIDCEDSFVQNLANYCRRLGADTTVWSAHAPVEAAWYRPPTHLILSPGPGRPDDFPSLRHHLMRAQRAKVPILGVCLGHQAIGQLLGAEVVRHPQTVHGKSARVLKTPAGDRDAVVGDWRGRQAGRYHSLVVEHLPADLVPLATLEDGTVMAMRHHALPMWGLQFHPESLLTEHGMDLMESFLRVGLDE